jgi:hypothetical protein
MDHGWSGDILPMYLGGKDENPQQVLSINTCVDGNGYVAVERNDNHGECADQ